MSIDTGRVRYTAQDSENGPESNVHTVTADFLLHDILVEPQNVLTAEVWSRVDAPEANETIAMLVSENASREVITSSGSYDKHHIKTRKHETRLGHNWRTFPKAKRALAGAAIAGSIATIPFGLYLEYDVTPERARLSQTQPELYNVYPSANQANADTVVLVVEGLGNLSGVTTAKSLKSLSEIGEVWALKYDNEGIDTEVITELVDEKMVDEDKDKIVIVGKSMGGITGTEIATGLGDRVAGIIYDCTPPDLDSVRSSARTRGEDMSRYMKIIPGAAHSRLLRTVVEVAAKDDRFTDGPLWNPKTDLDISDLLEVTDEVLQNKILSTNAASNALIGQQFDKIAFAENAKDITTIRNNTKDKRDLVLVYLRPRNANADTTTDVEMAESKIEASAEQNGLSLTTIEMDGTGHANPNQEPEIYNAAIGSYVVDLFVDTPSHVSTTGEILAQPLPPKK